MKKTIIVISAALCFMLSSCGTDSEQTAVTTASQAGAAYTEKTTQSDVVETDPNAQCCTPQTASDTVLYEESVPGCCSPDFSQIGGCCGE
mgnify:CR=1 FL=1